MLLKYRQGFGGEIAQPLFFAFFSLSSVPFDGRLLCFQYLLRVRLIESRAGKLGQLVVLGLVFRADHPRQEHLVARNNRLELITQLAVDIGKLRAEFFQLRCCSFLSRELPELDAPQTTLVSLHGERFIGRSQHLPGTAVDVKLRQTTHWKKKHGNSSRQSHTFVGPSPTTRVTAKQRIEKADSLLANGDLKGRPSSLRDVIGNSVASHLGGGVKAEPLHDGRAMEFGGAHGNIQLVCDILRAASHGNQPKDFTLPGG